MGLGTGQKASSTPGLRLNASYPQKIVDLVDCHEMFQSAHW